MNFDAQVLQNKKIFPSVVVSKNERVMDQTCQRYTETSMFIIEANNYDQILMSHHRPGILLKNLRFSSVLAKALIPTDLRKLEKI